jgi:hypothetical protein
MASRAEPDARRWHAVTAAVAALAVVLQFVLVVQGHRPLAGSESTAGAPPALVTRLVRFCGYLTIWFNVLVAATSATLAANPSRDGRAWRALRLDAVVIAVAGGLVHWFLLRPILDLQGADYIADKLLHVAVPLLALGGWLIYGPRGRIDGTDLITFLVVPAVWITYTLIRGALVSWYPYPFLDVNRHGYPKVLAISVTIAALMFGLAVVGYWLDRKLRRS